MIFVFLMLNNLTDDAEHRTYGGYHKQHIFIQGPNSAKNLSTITSLGS